MKLTNETSDAAIIHELGARIARTRLERNLTQAQLATEAGISKRTLERIEGGTVAAQLSALIRICRALDLVERLDLLIPVPSPSPVEQLKRRGRIRRRASVPRSTAVEEPRPWTWGESS